VTQDQVAEPIRVVAAAEASRRLGLSRKWWVLLAVGSGSFMSALDASVVNTILPLLNQAFGNVATVEWVVTIYLLVVSGLLLGFGRLGDIRGHKLTYLSGYAVFVAASALCGLAPRVEVLIVARAVQALGAAMLFANSPAILTGSFPASERGRALGLQGTMTYLGLTAGPSLGGWLATVFGWRAVFFINVPVGLVALLIGWRSIPYDTPSGRRERFDLLGAFIFLLGLSGLLLALNQGYAWGWRSPLTLGLLAAATLLLAVFLLVEWRVPSPMLDLSLFRRRAFSAATASAVLNYVCAYCMLFLLPFALIQGRGLNPSQAGLVLTAQPLVMAIAAPLSGTLSDRVGTRLPGTLGMLVLSAGLFLVSRLGPSAPLSSVALGLAVVGLGSGLFTSPNNSALMGAAPRHRQGIAGGVLALARNVGMALGVGLAGAVFTTVLAQASGAPSPATIFSAVSLGLLVASGLAMLGALTSAVR